MKIGLIGLKRAGKSEFGNIAVKEFGYKELAFADELKKYAKLLFPDHFKNNDKPVKLLQDFGEGMRKIDPDIWIKLLANNFDKITTELDELNVVVTDVRHQNEVDYLRSKGFTIVKIENNISDIIDRCRETESDFEPNLLNHVSEQLAKRDDVADITIHNKGTLEEYQNKVREFLSQN